MLAMAPEGTCGDGRCLLQFKTGAFVPGQPILPVLLTYNKRHHNPAWTIINEGWHFVSACTFVLLMWQVSAHCCLGHHQTCKFMSTAELRAVSGSTLL